MAIYCYWDEITGEYTCEDDGSGSDDFFGFSSDINNTGYGNLLDYGWEFSNSVWKDPSGETYDLSYLDPGIKGAAINFIKNLPKNAWNQVKNAFTDKDGNVDWTKLASLGGGVLSLLNRGTPQPASYQKPIPQYSAVRQQVPQEFVDQDAESRTALGMAVGNIPQDMRYDINQSGTITSADALAILRGQGLEQLPLSVPSRRPGSGGRRYFTDVQYVPKTGDTAAEALTAAQTSAGEQATGLATLNRANPYNVAPAPYVPPAPPEQTTQPAPEYDSAYSGENVLKTVQDLLNPPKMARGGIVGLQDGGFVVPADVVSHLGNGSSRAGLAHLQKRGAVPIQGRGDGMSDSNRTMINNRQPAAVADGEAYLPPNRVQQMGGPERLYAMMDRIRKDRTGTTQQGRQINPNKYLG